VVGKKKTLTLKCVLDTRKEWEGVICKANDGLPLNVVVKNLDEARKKYHAVEKKYFEQNPDLDFREKDHP